MYCVLVNNTIFELQIIKTTKMKTRFFFLGLLTALQCFSQNVTIPDANFKAYLVGDLSINTNGDSEIQVSEAVSYVGVINCSGRNILDLTGIEAFTEITRLFCEANQLTALNVTQNRKLLTLSCRNNQLSSLDVTQNTNLTALLCAFNQLASLDVSQNLDLVHLISEGNLLSTLDITQNTRLQTLFLDLNQLTTINTSNNTDLAMFSCVSNQLTNLSLVNNINLRRLGVDNNQLSSLNLSNNLMLESLEAMSNQLISLDLSAHSVLSNVRLHSNQLTYLNLKNGNNVNVDTSLFTITGNPNLNCVEVDNAAYSNANWPHKDTHTSYSNNCNACVVAIPDVNFKNAVLNHLPVIDTDNDGEIQCSEAAAVTGMLNVANKSIVDTTGLEAFINITRLAMFNNNVTTIDLTFNTQIQQLLLETNQLTTIDVSMLSFLTDFKAHSNQLTTANLANGNNTNMNRMHLHGNLSLTCIQIDAGFTPPNNNTWVKDNTANYNVNCTPCIVNIPDVNFKNAVLNHIPVIDTNNDGEIQCSEAAAVTGMLNVANKSIVDTTGLEAFMNITRLAMFRNTIQNIDLTFNTQIRQLLLETNQLTTIDVSMLSFLTDFKAHSNLLINVNLANGNNANMHRMQLQGNSSLTCIKIDTGFTPPTNNTWLKDSSANYTTSCPLFPIANNSTQKLLPSKSTSKQISTDGVVVYPNPVVDVVNVKSNNLIKKLSLFTIEGIEVLSKNKTNELNISVLNKGIYWLIIQTETEVITKKIIKK